MSPEQLSRISVIDPLTPAFERVKTILFKPFDLGKWFVIGFCAWLAYLGEQGGGGGPNFQRGGDPREVFGQAKDFLYENLYWIIPVGVIVIIVIVVISLLVTWLSSRGRFMFLHCVARNKAEVKAPWKEFGQHANSLFLFRIVVGIIGFFAVALFALMVSLTAFFSKVRFGFNVFSIGSIVLGGLVFVAAIVVLLVIKAFTTDFVVPIMFLQTTNCLDGWRRFLEILSARKGAFALYILFRILIGIAIGVMVLAVVLATCCCAGCILAIPYIGTVLMLPVLVFTRSYSLYYLRQYGPEFDVFSPEAQAAG
jgi:hypothetical protein